jgi:betaine reductase
MGDPAYAGPLTEVPLGLAVYHIIEPVLKEEIDPAVYEEQLGMMEMVLDIDALTAEVSAMREQGSKY